MSRIEHLPTEGPIVVIGVGNPYRCDDGVGHRVVEALAAEADAADDDRDALRGRPGRLAQARFEVTDGEPARLIELWRGAQLVVVVDAVVSGAVPGRLKVWDAAVQELPSRAGTSTHASGVGEAHALGAALDALPERLLVVGVEAACTDDGTELSSEVARAVPAAVRLVKAALATAGSHPSSHVPASAFVLAPPSTAATSSTPTTNSTLSPSSRTGATT